ncbi:11441_t:CDS:2 [Funneliformis mosseae]|uniref:11441_t:CDS:1 n=1 Tax=Funneliformis mosseae TaxID=27381 RepID=A0A9N9BE45_FUNMO|nr:11441_t:CDS:2 [Funneliformis mosseae]
MNKVDLQDFKQKLQFKDPTEPEELYLDNKKIMTISNIISSDQSDFTPLTELINLKSLSMNRTHLHSLEGFPTLPKLRRLALSDNKLTGGLEAFVNAKLEKLIHLDLSDSEEENEENQEAEISEEAISDEAGSESDQDIEANDEVSDNEEELEASEIEADTNIAPKPRNKGKQVAFPPDLDDKTESESESEYESGEEGPGIDYLLEPNLPEDTDEEDFQPDEEDDDEESDQLDEASDVDPAELPTTSAAGAAFEARAAASSTSKRKSFDEGSESNVTQKRLNNDDDETIQIKKRRV